MTRLTLLLAIALFAAPVSAHPGHHTDEDTRIEAEVPDGTSGTVAGSAPAAPLPWTSLEALDAEARFHFVVVSDRTGGHRAGIWQRAMDTIDLMQPAFVVSVGDLIEGYTEDRRQLTREWDEIDSMIATLDSPFFYVSGNHDYSNQVMADVWAERLGPSYYSFTYKGALFVVLNSALFDREGVEGHGQRGGEWAAEQERQLAWLERVLAQNEDTRWTFLFMHRPFWLDTWVRPEEGEVMPAFGPWKTHTDKPREWDRVKAALGSRPYSFFAGHEHVYNYQATEGVPHQHRITLASTGGVSGLRGVDYGEYDHFLWITMTDEGPVIANVLLDGVLPADAKQKYRRPWFAPRDQSDPAAAGE